MYDLPVSCFLCARVLDHSQAVQTPDGNWVCMWADAYACVRIARARLGSDLVTVLPNPKIDAEARRVLG